MLIKFYLTSLVFSNLFKKPTNSKVMRTHYAEVKADGKLVGLRGAFVTDSNQEIVESALENISNSIEIKKEDGENRYNARFSMADLEYDFHFPSNGHPVIGMYIDAAGEHVEKLKLTMGQLSQIFLGTNRVFPTESERSDIPKELLRETI